MHFKLIRLWQYGNGGSRSMHTPLCLCGRHTLYTVNARFILQCTIDVGTADSKVDFLVTADSTFRHTGDGELPSFRVTITLVHLEQIASKQASLVATGSCAYLHLYILGILRVLGYQGNLDFLLQLGLQCLVLGKFLTCHLLHLGIILVGQNVLSLFDTVQTGDVTLTRIHDIAQVFVFFSEFDETILVANDAWVSYQGRYLLKAGLKPVQFL